jgi:hypothetical protein
MEFLHGTLEATLSSGSLRGHRQCYHLQELPSRGPLHRIPSRRPPPGGTKWDGLVRTTPGDHLQSPCRRPHPRATHGTPKGPPPVKPSMGQHPGDTLQRNRSIGQPPGTLSKGTLPGYPTGTPQETPLRGPSRNPSSILPKGTPPGDPVYVTTSGDSA